MCRLLADFLDIIFQGKKLKILFFKNYHLHKTARMLACANNVPKMCKKCAENVQKVAKNVQLSGGKNSAIVIFLTKKCLKNLKFLKNFEKFYYNIRSF